MHQHPRLLFTAVLIVASGCGGGGTEPGSGSATGNNGGPGSTVSTITVSNNFFDPSSTSVTIGTRVTWPWDACVSDGYGGTSCSQHNVTFDDGPASSTRSDGTWGRTFTAAGTYRYHCTVHGSYMEGTIVVR